MARTTTVMVPQIGQADWEVLRPCIPTDHAQQVTSRYYIPYLESIGADLQHVMDLGCGVGSSRAVFKGLDAAPMWVGVDIPDSMESQARSTDGEVVLFDGLRLPFGDRSFDVVYSHQVLEHVRFPDALLAEAARVLRTGGYFIGSTSQMEPFHSRSFWGGYTVPGLHSLMLDAGLHPLEFRPGIDAITLIERAYGGPDARAEYGKWFEESSPLNAKIDAWAQETGRGAGAANARKLRFCGQFSFLATKVRWDPEPARADS